MRKKSANEASREAVWGEGKGAVGLYPHCEASFQATMIENARKRCCWNCKILPDWFTVQITLLAALSRAKRAQRSTMGKKMW